MKSRCNLASTFKIHSKSHPCVYLRYTGDMRRDEMIMGLNIRKAPANRLSWPGLNVCKLSFSGWGGINSTRVMTMVSLWLIRSIDFDHRTWIINRSGEHGEWCLTFGLGGCVPVAAGRTFARVRIDHSVNWLWHWLGLRFCHVAQDAGRACSNIGSAGTRSMLAVLSHMSARWCRPAVKRLSLNVYRPSAVYHPIAKMRRVALGNVGVQFVCAGCTSQDVGDFQESARIGAFA